MRKYSPHIHLKHMKLYWVCNFKTAYETQEENIINYKVI